MIFKMDELIKLVEKEVNGEVKQFPDFAPGDTVNVYIKVKEGNKERTQQFQGTVIARKNRNTNGETFSVRKISHGIGVEKTFPIIAPNIENIEVKRYGSVRKAKIYYLRERYGKAASVREKRIVTKTK